MTDRDEVLVFVPARQGGKTAELAAALQRYDYEQRDVELKPVVVDERYLTAVAPRRQTWQDQRKHLESRGRRRHGP